MADGPDEGTKYHHFHQLTMQETLVRPLSALF